MFLPSPPSQRKRDARDALHGFSEIAVREFADVFGNDAVDRRGRVTLLAERGIQGAAKAGDDHLFELLARPFVAVRGDA